MKCSFERSKDAIRFLCLNKNMEEITHDSSYTHYSDIAYKLNQNKIGFIFKNKITDDALEKIVFSRSIFDYVYIVLDSIDAYIEIKNKIPTEFGVICYSNEYGFGFAYRELQKGIRLDDY